MIPELQILINDGNNQTVTAETSVPLEQIMDKFSHSDDQITKDVYLHVTKYKKSTGRPPIGDKHKTSRLEGCSLPSGRIGL